MEAVNSTTPHWWISMYVQIATFKDTVLFVLWVGHAGHIGIFVCKLNWVRELWVCVFTSSLSLLTSVKQYTVRRPTADPIFIPFPESEFIEAVKPVSALPWTAVASALNLWLEVWGQCR